MLHFRIFLPLHAHANELSPSAIVLTQGPYVDYLDNGDYIITTIEESSNNLQLASTTKTKNGTKSTSYYNKNH